MATLGNAGRVGAVVLIALALLGAMYTFFVGGLFRHTYTCGVTFDDARGIDKDSPVQLAGVRIGAVDHVDLVGQKAVLTLRLKSKINGHEYRVPRNSRFTITTPLLGSTGVVTVIPPPDAAKHPQGFITDGESDLVGERSGDLTASFDKTAVLLGKAGTLLDKLNGVVGNPRLQRNLEAATSNVAAASANANVASANGVKLTRQLNAVFAQDNAQLLRLLNEDNGQVQALLRQTRTGARAATGNLVDVTAQLRATTRANRAQIDAILVNVKDTTSSVAGITAQTEDLLKNGDVTKNLSATVANLKAATDKLNAIAGSFQSMTGDVTVQNNLKATVQNIRDSSESAKFLLERLNRLAGGRRPAVVSVPGGPTVVIPTTGTAPGRGASGVVPLFLPRVDLTQNTRTNRFRADVDAVAPLAPLGLTPDSFGRIGIYGLGDQSRAILQVGQMAGRQGQYDYRAGLYASKLSVGGDIGLGRRASFSFDVYDPNLVHVDARGVLMLSDALGLTVGGEDITRHGGVTVGLEFRH